MRGLFRAMSALCVAAAVVVVASSVLVVFGRPLVPDRLLLVLMGFALAVMVAAALGSGAPAADRALWTLRGGMAAWAVVAAVVAAAATSDATISHVAGVFTAMTLLEGAGASWARARAEVHPGEARDAATIPSWTVDPEPTLDNPDSLGAVATEEDVERLLGRLYGDPARRAQARSLIEGYGQEAHHDEVVRVRAALLKLAGDDLDELGQVVAAARDDYRDVLMWAEYPRESILVPRGYVTADEAQELAHARGLDREEYRRWLRGDNS